MPEENCDSVILDPFAGKVQDVTEVRLQETLLNNGALQHAIFNSANFSMIATDAQGVIQIFNVGAERMLGYTAAEVMNKITPADISDPQEVIARAKALSVELSTTITPGFEALVFKASRGIEDIYELTYIRKDGSRFPAVVSVTALRDAQNAIIGYLLIGTDNTARKRAEEELLNAGALRITSTLPAITDHDETSSPKWADLAVKAVGAFFEDHGHEPKSWDEQKEWNEKYLKPLLFFHLGNSVTESEPMNEEAMSSFAAQAATRLQADRGTAVKQLARYFERFGR